MKRLISLTLCLVILLLCGCETQKKPYIPTGNGLAGEASTAPETQPPEVEQQLSLIYYEGKGLNPYRVADYTNRVLFPLVYQSLFVTDRDYGVYPILCKQYSVSRDLKTYVFYLENATFSDGTALTAQDVAASLLAAKAGPVYAGRLGNVQAVTVLEDGGVEVKLSTAYGNLPLLLDIPILKASEVDLDFPLGTGPYKHTQTSTGPGLVRRSDWWCKASMDVTATYIPLRSAVDPGQIRDTFEYGKADLVCTDPGSDSYVDYRSDHEIWECENGIFLYLGCNGFSKIFADQELRRALTHAIDREAIVEGYYRGFASAASLPVSPDSPWYNAALAGKYDYQKGTLEALIQAKGLEGTAIRLLVNKDDSRRVRVANFIADALNQAGLQVTVSGQSGENYLNALKWGNFDLHLGQTVLSPNMDLSPFYDPKGTLNYGGMSDAVVAAACRDALENEGNYYTLHQLAMEDAMLCPILFRSYAVYATRGTLSEMEPARDQILFYTLGKTLADARIG